MDLPGHPYTMQSISFSAQGKEILYIWGSDRGRGGGYLSVPPVRHHDRTVNGLPGTSPPGLHLIWGSGTAGGVSTGVLGPLPSS